MRKGGVRGRRLPDLPRNLPGGVAGSYLLTELSFDPQGSPGEVDLLQRLAVANPNVQLWTVR